MDVFRTLKNIYIRSKIEYEDNVSNACGRVNVLKHITYIIIL